MSSKTTKQIGNEGEEIAVAYLESKGYTILERNYFFERAEVDIVAYDESCLSFIEVKMRSSTKFGAPEESVTQEKMNNIYRAAEAWIYERKMDGVPVRFDIIAIVQQDNDAPDITHYENAFRPGRS